MACWSNTNYVKELGTVEDCRKRMCCWSFGFETTHVEKL